MLTRIWTNWSLRGRKSKWGHRAVGGPVRRNSRATTLGNSMAAPQEMKGSISSRCSPPTVGYMSGRTESWVSDRHLHIHVHHSSR